MTTILLADDQELIRTGLRMIFAVEDDFAIVGEAADGHEAVDLARSLHPDVILMDIRMPVLDGVEATRRISAAVPEVAVLVLTMYDDDATVLTAMRAGARGYLLKGAEQDEIVAAIRAVAAGQVIYGPGVAARMLSHFAAPAASTVPFPELTEREREILTLLASGLRNAAIAKQLFLSPKTVSNNLTAIFAKLRVADRSAAIIRARDEGLGT